MRVARKIKSVTPGIDLTNQKNSAKMERSCEPPARQPFSRQTGIFKKDVRILAYNLYRNLWMTDKVLKNSIINPVVPTLETCPGYSSSTMTLQSQN